MNHHTKPHFQTVVEKQRLAHHHLKRNNRSPIEISGFERQLAPCPISDVELPQLPLVRLKKADGPFTRWVVLGEVAQMAGKVILMDIDTGIIELGFSADELELAPPTELP